MVRVVVVVVVEEEDVVGAEGAVAKVASDQEKVAMAKESNGIFLEEKELENLNDHRTHTHVLQNTNTM